MIATYFLFTTPNPVKAIVRESKQMVYHFNPALFHPYLSLICVSLPGNIATLLTPPIWIMEDGSFDAHRSGNRSIYT